MPGANGIFINDFVFQSLMKTTLSSYIFYERISFTNGHIPISLIVVLAEALHLRKHETFVMELIFIFFFKIRKPVKQATCYNS